MASLKAIAERHADWIKMAAYLGSESPEDTVQDMYLKLAESPDIVAKIDYNGDINTMYIFTIIRSKVVDRQRKSKRENYDDVLFDPCFNADESERQYQNLMDDVKSVIDEMPEYDQMLLELHFVYKLSMRDIEKRTGIPLHSIFNRLKNAKNLIKNHTYVQYQNYCEAQNAKETIARTRRYGREGDQSHWD